MITTIQLHEEVKNELDSLKETGKESYEEVILKLIERAEKQNREHGRLLIEGYKEMSEESSRITKEWSSTEKGWD